MFSMPVPEISAEEVQRRLAAGEKLTVVDIREPFEWQASGVIPGARLSPMRPFLLTQLDSLEKDEEIIVVCAHAVRSADAALYMAAKGFKNVRSMAGGMAAWRGPVVEPKL
jgi:rhodanese-related sulfurtransferase